MKISIALRCYDFPLSQGHTFLFCSFCVTKKKEKNHKTKPSVRHTKAGTKVPPMGVLM